MFGVFAGIKVQSERLNYFKAGINRLNILFDFNIEGSFVFVKKIWDYYIVYNIFIRIVVGKLFNLINL